MDSITLWTWSLIAGGAVIVIVAVLLLAILATARRIDTHAQAVWQAGKNIAGNTVSIWMLNRTNQVARDILTTARSIDATTQSLAEKLGSNRGET
ncbi:hypothetical protein [Candidatus Entotheonella palauensis]|uniref:Uncharacterized protein n=1 Tax=Candidatus Entotheonella gemina TaxID=1429439 RepID=W4MBC6_9BACT|nr:hypothetical protein [Candidatus Entotheonella palauensis]ETX07508.1 MAG: hypothetical protein ETSY2_10720 [Candidatus Entotheonella gemina]